MPPAPKPANRRQRRNATGVGLVPRMDTTVAVLAPPPPARLTKAQQERWAKLWASPLARLIEQSDMPALERLFGLYDMVARAERATRGKWLERGSTGQLVAHPLLKEASTWRKEILELERQFGIGGPLSRLKLGVEFGNAHRSLSDLNAEIEADDDDAEDQDFRVARQVS